MPGRPRAPSWHGRPGKQFGRRATLPAVRLPMGLAAELSAIRGTNCRSLSVGTPAQPEHPAIGGTNTRKRRNGRSLSVAALAYQTPCF
ncbi:hypothetical protein GQ53DRAFT_330251 [Thozetella sp. PMI_491]|nr:hypothetical protein GQ53DRAFT_330251 [Thozetella sp. PMI_491]